MARRYEPNFLILGIPVTLILGGIGLYAYFTRPPLQGDLLRGADGRYREPPAATLTWPWPNAAQSRPHLGVRRWRTADVDGTSLELIEFDYGTNPGLRLELYDQDMDDAQPFDDEAGYYALGVGQATRHLNERRHGTVVAAWNGLFFNYDHSKGGPRGVAHHVGPVVLDGRARYNVGNPRWTFGVRHTGAGPRYEVLLQPKKEILEATYDYAGAGAQYLVRSGKPMRLRKPPGPGQLPPPQPVPCDPDEAGHIPSVDFLKTSRTSMGWSKDARRFYLLIVREPDNELESKLAYKRGQAPKGGWSLADLQRFWLRFGVWGAVNVDGGVVTQMTCLRNDGNYDLVPPELVGLSNETLIFDPAFANAPEGGTLMYFYIRDAGLTSPRAAAGR